MSEHYEPVTHLQTDPKLRRHLRRFVAFAEDLTERGFYRPETLTTPPHRTEIWNGGHHVYWELLESDRTLFERLAVHVSTQGLMIAHEHLHNDEQLEHDEYRRSTLVISGRKARLYHTDTSRITPIPSEFITNSFDKSDAYMRRLGHAASLLGAYPQTHASENTGQSLILSATAASL